ncbi:three-helix bundle dimerization domain-containing protein [Streptomyces sp. NPDC002187]|uniref:three-helix bundle dimerization domain-containing protein n=1 Tax=Streptomyces sp. NPDC002187 TaxID=3364637 RepID=UPI00369E128A
MTAGRQTPQVGAWLPVEEGSRSPGPVGHAHPAMPPKVPPSVPQDELAAVRNVVARLAAVSPWADAATVEAAVLTAYATFREARVRTYVPILVERRARKVLLATCAAVAAEAAPVVSTEGGEQSVAAARARDGRRSP